MKPVLPAGNPAKAKLYILQEAPSEAEEALGEPFVGPLYTLLKETLNECGITLQSDEVYRACLYSSRPPRGDIGRVGEIGGGILESAREFSRTVQQHNPHCILALGSAALDATTGSGNKILKYRGSILPYRYMQSVKVVATLHPATLRGQHYSDAAAPKHYYKYLIADDIRKAVRESSSAAWTIPKRSIAIAKSGKQLWDWMAGHRPRVVPRRLSVDIEQFKTIPVCIALSYDAIHAVSVPLLNLNFSPGWKEIPESELLYMWSLVDQMVSDHDTELVGQNLKHDWQKIYHALGFRPRGFCGDSMHLANLLNPEFPKSLGFIASYLTDEPYWKDEGADFWKEGGFKRNSVDDLMVYNAKDAAVTWEIVDKQLAECAERGLSEFYEAQVRPLHLMYVDIENEGMAYDFEVKAALLLKYLLLRARKERELFGMLGRVFNWRSPKQMPALMYDELGFPQREKLDEDSLVALYCNHTKGKDGERKRRIIDLILELKRLDKAMQFMHALPDWDEKYRSVFNPAQAETGRSSTSIQDPPTRLEIKAAYGIGGKPKNCHLGLAFHTITKHGELGADVRRIFTPGSGYVFMEVDLSQAEARIVAHLADDQETLKLFNTTDIHTLTTTWIFGIPYETVTSELRFVGKTCRHAGNYGMGKRRLMMEIMTGAKKQGLNLPPIDEKTAQDILNKFHAATPKIRGVFHVLVQKALADGNRMLFNAYGRPRQFLDYWGDKLWQEGYAQIPQSTVRDKNIQTMIEMRAYNWGDCEPPRICIEPHDAVILKVRESDAMPVARIVKQIMEKPIDFSKCSIKRGGLVIPAEIKISKENYKDLKKFEVAP